MITRSGYQHQLRQGLKRSPIVALLGPRQCGKTTLAKVIAAEWDHHDYFDLESIQDQTRLQNPEMVLENAEGLVVIDEIQERPDLFGILRSLVDRKSCNARYLILGSASPQLVQGASESLAGRVEFVDLAPFGIHEVGNEHWVKLWNRGGFPRSFLASGDEDSAAWREGFVRTFLQRDLPQLGITIPAPALRRFWTMLAHYHGQTWNASAISRSMGVSDKTVRGYLDILTEAYMIRQLQPYYSNAGKRQVKAPKIYFRDTGLLHHLLTLHTEEAVMSHPAVGASWEGFALEQILRVLRPAEAYFWAAYSGGEVDLIFDRQGVRYGIEFKYSEAPKITRAMKSYVKDLDLAHLWIVCPCRKSYDVTEHISVTNLAEMPNY
jgi:predicted AAA+ superfamily ATPase